MYFFRAIVKLSTDINNAVAESRDLHDIVMAELHTLNDKFEEFTKKAGKTSGKAHMTPSLRVSIVFSDFCNEFQSRGMLQTYGHVLKK